MGIFNKNKQKKETRQHVLERRAMGHRNRQEERADLIHNVRLNNSGFNKGTQHSKKKHSLRCASERKVAARA